jgi:hypothetical protein
LKQLVDYKKKNGDCNVPQSSKGYGDLGGWVTYRRQYYKNYKENKPRPSITKGRIRALEKLGFVWRLNTDSRPMERPEQRPVPVRFLLAQMENDDEDAAVDPSDIALEASPVECAEEGYGDDDIEDEDDGDWRDVGEEDYDDNDDCLVF